MLEVTRAGAVLTLRLDRPASRNAFDDELIARLREALGDAEGDAATAVVVLGSTDPRAFSGGMDVRSPSLPETTRSLLQLQWQVETFPKPVIAELDGHVVGGGAEIALGADLRIGSPAVQFRFPASRYGIVQGTWHLASAVGQARAKELVMTGRPVGAEEALRIGLLHEVADAVGERTAELAQHLASRNQRSLREMKRLFGEAAGRTLEERFEAERAANEELIHGVDL